MNANELPADQLADLLDEIPVGDFESLDHHHFTRQAATMLRQQQAEIERLTMLCDCMTTESNRKGNEIEALKVKAHEWYLIAMGKAQEK